LGGESEPMSAFMADSPLVRDAFRKYLEDKYANIDALNTVWQENYRDFGSIPVTREMRNKWANYEWRVFRSRTAANYMGYLTEPFREFTPSISVSPVVGMNQMHPGHTDSLEHFMIAEAGGLYLKGALDTYPAGRDRYPHHLIAVNLSVPRSLSEDGRVWIGELGHVATPTEGWQPYDGIIREANLREWYYTAFIHGAMGVAAFNWASGASIHALQYPGHIPTPTALKIAEVAAEAREFGNIWACAPDVEAALYYPRISHFLYTEATEAAKRLEMMGLWALMRDCGFMIDPVDRSILLSRLDRYKILVIPPAPYLPLDVQERVAEYVSSGGLVITSELTGEFDEWGGKSRSVFRGLVENTQTGSNVSHGKGFVLVVPGSIGRTYRDDWHTGMGIRNPVPPVLGRDAAGGIRNELRRFLEEKGRVPVSYSSTDEVETAVIKSSTDSYLVLINHSYKSAQPVITLNTGDENAVLVEMLTLEEYPLKGRKMSFEMEAKGVLFLRIPGNRGE
jgi:beta-galactosidase GanA